MIHVKGYFSLNEEDKNSSERGSNNIKYAKNLPFEVQRGSCDDVYPGSPNVLNKRVGHCPSLYDTIRRESGPYTPYKQQTDGTLDFGFFSGVDI